MGLKVPKTNRPLNRQNQGCATARTQHLTISPRRTPSNPLLPPSGFGRERTKGCGSRLATLTKVYKLGLEAQKAWRRLNGADQIAKVITGVRFADGVEITKNQQAA